MQNPFPQRVGKIVLLHKICDQSDGLQVRVFADFMKRKIVPPVYLLLALLAMTALHFLMPMSRWLTPPWSYAGVGLMVLGAFMTLVSAGAFKRAGTPVIPFEPSTVLVTSGFYRLTRNPMYLGMVSVLLGAGMLFGTIGAFTPIPIFVWIIQTQFIEGEERFLAEIFGEQYRDYQRRVRRWL
jgi:protein-S-isoprenylcysteine O-methyltransferase Ste14